MATPNIVPRADQEGGLGTAAKSWGKLFIENPTSGGTAAVTISNLDVDKIALDVNANNTTANIIDVASTSLTTGSLLNFVGTTTPADTASNTLVNLDVDFDGVGTSDFKGIYMNLDKDGITASGKTSNVYGLHIDLDDSVTNVGTVNTYGAKIDNHFANTGGTATAYGIDLDVDGGDTNIGMQINTAGTHLKLVANADVNDYATLSVANTGDLTVATVGNGTTDSDLILDVDGNVEINADGGTIEFKDGGTNLVSIDSTGALRSLNYRTLYIDAGSMVPQVTNGATAGTEEASTNDVMNDYYAFDTSTTEYVQFKTVLPEQWDAGTIKAKFYWKPNTSTTTSHTVAWQIQATAAADGGTIDSSWGTVQEVNDDVLGTAAGRVHLTAATPAVTVAGSPGTGSDNLVYFRVLRPSGSVVADDLNEDAHLLGVLIQYKESLTTDAAW